MFRQVSKRMDRARNEYAAFPHEPARRRLYRRCLRQVARQRGGIAAGYGMSRGGWVVRESTDFRSQLSN